MASPRLAAAVALLALLALLAGCTGQPAAPAPPPEEEGPPLPMFGAPVQALADCPDRFDQCYEPTIAADAEGRLFVTDAFGESLAASDDGGFTWQALAPPPMPQGAPPRLFRNDVLLQVAPDGRLFYSAMLMEFLPLAFPMSPRFATVGLQVASSSDGGATWGTNAWVGLPEAPPAETPAPPSGLPLVPTRVDRQWLAFDPAGPAYLTFVHAAGRELDHEGIWMARSDDGGSRFGAPRLLRGDAFLGGQPQVVPGGRLLVPFMGLEDGALALVVLRSDDQGATFEAAVVDPGPSPGSFFPSLAVGPDGAALLAWKDGAGLVALARSEDGGATWSAPQPAPAAGGEGTAVGPWVAFRADGGHDLLYHNVTGEDGVTDLRLARWTTDAQALVSIVEGMPQTGRYPGNTDFAHFATLPDGRLATAWPVGNQGVWVAVEGR